MKDWFAVWQYVFHQCLSMFVGEIPDSDVNTIYTRFIELFEDCCARYAIQTWLKTRSKIILHLGNAPDQALIFRNSVCSVSKKQKIIFLRKRHRHFYCFWCNWVILWRLWQTFILFRIIILHQDRTKMIAKVTALGSHLKLTCKFSSEIKLNLYLK